MPTPDARHRHEKARPQRVAARRGVHHLARLHEITPRLREIPSRQVGPVTSAKAMSASAASVGAALGLQKQL